MPGWHTPRLNLPFLHSLLCAENLAHTSSPRPNLLDTDVKGLHETRQKQFGEGRTQRGSTRDISGLCCSKDGAQMGQTSQSMAEDRGMSSNLPQQGLCVHILSTESSFALVSHFLPSTNFMAVLDPCWWRAEDAPKKGQRQPQPQKHLPQPWIISTAHRGDSPLCCLQIAWVQPGLQVMGIWMKADNVFLDLSGCQKNPRGNQAKLPVRTVEDKQVFVRQLQITARLQYSKQYQEFSHRKSWNPACLTVKPCVFNKGWKTVWSNCAGYAEGTGQLDAF